MPLLAALALVVPAARADILCGSLDAFHACPETHAPTLTVTLFFDACGCQAPVAPSPLAPVLIALTRRCRPR